MTTMPFIPEENAIAVAVALANLPLAGSGLERKQALATVHYACAEVVDGELLRDLDRDQFHRWGRKARRWLTFAKERKAGETFTRIAPEPLPIPEVPVNYRDPRVLREENIRRSRRDWGTGQQIRVKAEIERSRAIKKNELANKASLENSRETALEGVNPEMFTQIDRALRQLRPNYGLDFVDGRIEFYLRGDGCLPFAVAAYGVALLLDSTKGYSKNGRFTSYQSRFGICQRPTCDTFFYKPSSNRGGPQLYCNDTCSGALRQERHRNRPRS